MRGTATAELDAAGIGPDRLRGDYLLCRELHARHGRTYFTATRVLPPERRPGVHALYGFARWVDDIVDEPEPGETAADVRERLDAVGADLGRALSGREPREPVLRALAHTVEGYGLPAGYFTAFMDSMRMDLDVTGYRDLEHLREYMYGSAAVIGLQVLPVLGTVAPRAEAAPHAAALGEAFQLTNFLRDVADDLGRGRVYLPADVLGAHGVDRELLEHCARVRAPDRRARAAVADLVEVNRGIYREAEPGIAMLSPVSRPCVATAFRLYRAILDEISAADFDVWSTRHRVSDARKVAAAVPALARSLLARSVPRPRSG
ncbi:MULTISPECIES: phytoene/squalene synthase family protein [Nocardiopsidaceae]|uniref:Phytoene/squalene synthase family protein n=1 Tax=Streptomonospora nanhaiensis TaxID=1323731 RepID=A0ABY6YR19_9ACTN|nr:phytoene/squalene synthase family protein [Streptomonospora nanhaiensis]WAE74688.1 phytoene/squalene synthase family protein [Streptomonospora nanhaiensis]